MRFVFFGTSDISVTCLEALLRAGHVPRAVVTQTDKPAGRGNVLTPPPVKIFAEKMELLVHQVDSIDASCSEFLSHFAIDDGVPPTDYWDCFVLVAFGIILPRELLSLPKKGVVNMHPSLLPKLRGPSPIRTALLRDEPTSVGVTVMKLDSKMDHGPIIAQEKLPISSLDQKWPMPGKMLDELLANRGADLLTRVLPAYVEGTLEVTEQDHKQATYCHFIHKSDAELLPTDTARQKLLKVCAYDGWPSAFVYVERNGVRMRVKITSAHLSDDESECVYDTCIPEGKKEMLWKDFLRG